MKIVYLNPNVLLLPIFIGLLNVTSLPAEISATVCHISSATIGESTTITCRFGVDAGDLREPVQVIHQINGNSETPVLTCIWEHSKISCVISKSYIFDGNINDTLQLQIPNATRAHEGKYACILMTQREWEYRFCDLLLYNGLQNSTYIDVTKVPAIKCIQSNTTEKRVCEEDNYHYVVPVVIVACVITVAVIAVLLFCIVKITKKIPKTQSEPITEMSDIPSQSNEVLLPENQPRRD